MSEPKLTQVHNKNEAAKAQRAEKPQAEQVETAVSAQPTLQRALADPDNITPNDAKILQRTFGNQAVRRFIIQRKMTVGPVGDKYEQETDAVAKQVVSTLNGTQSKPIQRQEEDEDLQMKPLQTVPTISTLQRQEEDEELQMKENPIFAGGTVSNDVESSVQNAKSSGQPLGNMVRRPMEHAFNADFSRVKIHTGGQADTLNRSLSARAFTSGQDIFFRKGEYSPASSSGQELLAHELTHTVQQGVSPQNHQAQRFPDNASGLISAEIQRSSMTIQRLFGSKKTPAEDTEDENLQWVENPAYEGEDEDIQWVENPMNQQAPAENGAAAPAEQAWTGKAGKHSSMVEEAGKPSAAISVSGGTAGIAAASAGGEFAAPAGVGTLGLIQMGDTIVGLNNARGMNAEAEKYNDKGMKNLAGRKMKDQGGGLAMATVGTAKGGANIANAVQAGSGVAGATGGVLGVVGGSAMVIQGAWRGGKAVMKLCRLTWGRGKETLSAAGARWKAVIMNTEKFKLAINALKIAAGALGIAAGVLIIVSNPVGWAIGLAAAIAGGVYTASKIAGKISNARDKDASKKKLAGQPSNSEAASSSDMVVEENWDMAEYRRKRDMARPRGEAVSSGGGEGFVKPKEEAPGLPEMVVEEDWDMAEYRRKRDMARPRGKSVDNSMAPPPEQDDAAKRKEAIEMANAVARDASKNAKIAGEMRAALSVGNKDAVASALNTKAGNPKTNLAELLIAPADQELHDAVQLLSAINVDPDEALSDSGQDLIEKKLSKAEAM